MYAFYTGVHTHDARTSSSALHHLASWDGDNAIYAYARDGIQHWRTAVNGACYTATCAEQRPVWNRPWRVTPIHQVNPLEYRLESVWRPADFVSNEDTASQFVAPKEIVVFVLLHDNKYCRIGLRSPHTVAERAHPIVSKSVC